MKSAIIARLALYKRKIIFARLLSTGNDRDQSDRHQSKYMIFIFNQQKTIAEKIMKSFIALYLKSMLQNLGSIGSEF